MIATATDINSQLAALGLSLDHKHIPMAGSLDTKTTTVDFRVTLMYNGRDAITTEYHMGLGHCTATSESKRPAPRLPNLTMDYFNSLQGTLRGEKAHRWDDIRWTLPTPALAGVLSSLLLDSSVLDYPTFESWASDCGYDTDSRKAEAIYNACLANALKLTAGIPRDVLGAARDILADY